MPRLREEEWARVEAVATWAARRRHGLPSRRGGSVLVGTFNVRELGSARDRTGGARSGRTPGAWRLLARACAAFDLLAVQEVLDDLSGVLRLRDEVEARHGRRLEVLVSDIAGHRPGLGGQAERLAFLYDPRRIAHTELAAEITSDRGRVCDVLLDRRTDFADRLEAHAAEVTAWEARRPRRGARPWLALPCFLTFMRPPHVASFRVRARGDAEPIDLLAVNAHLLYGRDDDERLWEFLELVEWLALRAKYPDRLYAPNLVLLGDCNLETEHLAEVVAAERALAGDPPAAATASARDFLEWKIKSLNDARLTSRRSAEANFPLLDVHPRQGVLRTNARHAQTYDQIGLFVRDERLPRHDANEVVTGRGDAYDYGVFRFPDLVAEALAPDAWAAAAAEAEAAAADGAPAGSPFPRLPESVRDRVVRALEWDVSDHLPAWIRLPVPGA